jgi:hypothetical protein
MYLCHWFQSVQNKVHECSSSHLHPHWCLIRWHSSAPHVRSECSVISFILSSTSVPLSSPLSNLWIFFPKSLRIILLFFIFLEHPHPSENYYLLPGFCYSFLTCLFRDMYALSLIFWPLSTYWSRRNLKNRAKHPPPHTHIKLIKTTQLIRFLNS